MSENGAIKNGASSNGAANGNAEVPAAIDVLVRERRTFEPSAEFVEQALIKDRSVYEEADADYEGFWLARAKEFVEWYKEPTESLAWDPPHCTWFADGELNVSYNCLDKQINKGNGDKVAYHFVSESPDEEDQPITYSELKDEVCRLSNALRELGVKKGDRVAIYMGMVPQLPIAMLACARIGAPHVVVFGGFSVESLGERMEGTGASVLITQDEAWRKGGRVPLKKIADGAVKLAPSVEHVVVYKRTGGDVPFDETRDVWWHDIVEDASTEFEPERCAAEDTLFLLHTSGTTAKPKAPQHTTVDT